jgi:enamine deaminase RidA (YjgF/YER057c/UK114 family)
VSCKTTHRDGAATLYVTPMCEGVVYVTAVLDESSDARRAALDAYGRLADILAESELRIVHERVFGSLTAGAPALQGRSEALGRRGILSETPLTYLQGRPLWGEGLAGLSVMAVRPADAGELWTVRDEAGAPRGRAWKFCGATFMVLQSLHGHQDGPGTDNTRCAQADRMFDRANQLLQGQHTDYRNVTRTWIYLSKILDWYGDFNEVRNAKYDGFGLMPRRGAPGGNSILLPASTGIEGDAPNRAAATMDVLATIPGPDSAVEIHQMTNVKQRDAFRYGSAFSRGAAIRLPGATWISISGTASIDEEGVTVHQGDFSRQMHGTLDTIEALIAQEGAALSDICDATIFIKRAEDVEAYRQALTERGLEDIAGVPVIADVCRDDLLFEMDGAAVVTKE